jgi:putative N6-adenine-specific DNA methylase
VEKTAVALCAVGAEKVVAQEIRKLGLGVEESGFGRVRFHADLAGLYRSLMALRAADRVLLETAFFPAEDFDALFEGARAVPWEEFIPRGMGLVVAKVRTNRSKLRAETSIQAVVHKAAAERLCDEYHIKRLPDGGKMADLRVYIEKDRVSLLLDLSGEPLFKRGYRREGGIAPLRETTAAALLQLALWRRKFPLYDPFCGSGTILVEALLYAWDAAPGLGRTFALGDLLIADAALERSIRDELRQRVNFEHRVRIAGSDRDSRAVSIAASNIRRACDLVMGRTPVDGIRPSAGVEVAALPEEVALPKEAALPKVVCLSLEAARSPFVEDVSGAPDAGFIITNPPYGKRLGEPGDAEACYAAMPVLGRSFPGWHLAVITDHPGFESFFGHKADTCREITNGAIPSYFFQYGQL